MEPNIKRKRLVFIQLIIGICVSIMILFNTRNAILYGVLGLIALALVHWVLREKVKQDINFLAFTLITLTGYIVLDYIAEKVTLSNNNTSSTLVVLSYIPLIVLFIGCFIVVYKFVRSRKDSSK